MEAEWIRELLKEGGVSLAASGIFLFLLRQLFRSLIQYIDAQTALLRRFHEKTLPRIEKGMNRAIEHFKQEEEFQEQMLLLQQRTPQPPSRMFRQ